jgi:putative acetyltransferase
MRQDNVTEREVAAALIRQAMLPGDLDDARRLFLEYAAWLKVDLCFQGFERELATLPGAYAPPGGRLLLVGEPGEAFACIALRPLEGPPRAGLDLGACGGLSASCGDSAAVAQKVASDPASIGAGAIGEVKRLYVQPARRGEGWGGRLARALIREARTIGYRELKLDTLAWMNEARALYARLGFRQCAPYYDNPLDGVVYMSLALSSSPPDRERASASENEP